MNTINIVLMVILAAMIGFGIGNVWGKEVMKRTLQSLLEQMITGMKNATSNNKDGE